LKSTRTTSCPVVVRGIADDGRSRPRVVTERIHFRRRRVQAKAWRIGLDDKSVISILKGKATVPRVQTKRIERGRQVVVVT
jgi:hypothetical protein